jgi:hypothetical protein
VARLGLETGTWREPSAEAVVQPSESPGQLSHDHDVPTRRILNAGLSGANKLVAFRRSAPTGSSFCSGQADTAAADLSHCSICAWLTTPACCITNRPPKNTMKFGIPRTWKRSASWGWLSVSTLRTTALPAISAAVRATSGAAAWHGPHHSAQKSTSTGTGTFCTTSSNSASSTAKGSVIGGKGDLHFPHRPVFAKNLAGTRFFWPQ